MNSGKKLLRAFSFLSLSLLLSTLFAAAAFADGASVYTANCASCHRLGTVDTSGLEPPTARPWPPAAGQHPIPGPAFPAHFPRD